MPLVLLTRPSYVLSLACLCYQREAFSENADDPIVKISALFADHLISSVLQPNLAWPVLVVRPFGLCQGADGFYQWNLRPAVQQALKLPWAEVMEVTECPHSHHLL